MVELNLKDIKAVIFDLDGTMVANQEYHKNAFIITLKNHGLSIDDEFYKTKISGGKNYFILKKVFPGISDADNNKLAEEKEQTYRNLYKKAVKEVPGLNNLIKNLKKKGLKVAIATTAPLVNRAFILKALNLENDFDIIVGEEDVINPKPDPEVYLKTIDKMRVKPEDCLAFEDSPSGVNSAKGAGIKTVVGVLTYHQAEDIKSADFFIKDFTEIELD